METISLRLYNEEKPSKKAFSEPKLLHEIDFCLKGKRILLADKIYRTGTTIKKATQILNDKGANKITPIAIAGEKNYCLFKTKECIECR